MLGRVRGVKFGLPAVQQITLETQKLGKTLGENLDAVVVPIIVYWGLWNCCYVKREDPDFTFEAVVEWVEDNLHRSELLAEIVKCFYESRVVKGNMQQEEEEEQKKSSTSQRRKDGKSSAPSSAAR